jgi:protein ImuB
MNKRIGCVLIPDFPLVVQLKEHPDLFGKPMILAENGSNRSGVLYANIHAESEGVSLGMTVVQAKNVCPDVCILIREEKGEQQRFDELLVKLQRFSPFIEEAKPGIVYLDVSGFSRTYPQEKDLAEKLIDFIRIEGYPVKMGMAGNKFTSLVGASISETYSYTIVPNGKEKEFLEQQPIQLLPIDQDLYERLCRLGIKTIGEFALLPDQEVAEKFGSQGLRLLKLARGEDDEKLKPKIFNEKDTQSRDFDSALETQVGIVFCVNSILEKQLNDLAKKGLACEEVLVILKTEDRSEIPIRLSLAQGNNNPKAFIELLRLELEKITLLTPVQEIQVIMQRTSPLSYEQLTLHHRKEPNLLSQKLTQLKRILGNGNILFPQIVSSHKPEGKFRMVSYTPPKDQNSKGKTKDKKLDRNPLFDPLELSFGFSRNAIFGLRLYNPPKPATVRAENRIIKFVIADSWYGEVVRQTGPWEISGEWWSDGFSRCYFEIELSGGEQYLIFFENSSKRWFLQGIFD